MNKPSSFWRWLFLGNGAGEGWRNHLSYWLLLDLIVGMIFGAGLTINLVDAAKSVLFPLASIFVGMAIAWASNSHSLLKAPEFDELRKRASVGLVEYVYPFMLGMLTLIATLVVWAVVAIGIDVSLLQGEWLIWFRHGLGVLMFFLISLSIRTSWRMVSLVVNIIIYSDFMKVSEKIQKGSGIAND